MHCRSIAALEAATLANPNSRMRTLHTHYDQDGFGATHTHT